MLRRLEERRFQVLATAAALSLLMSRTGLASGDGNLAVAAFMLPEDVYARKVAAAGHVGDSRRGPAITTAHAGDELYPGVLITQAKGKMVDVSVEALLDYDETVKKSFSSEKECYKFYNSYALDKGFTVRKCYVEREKATKEICLRKYVCGRQGFRAAKHINKAIKKRKARNITRCGCLAKLVIALDKETRLWFVKDFIDEHNHPLAPPDLSCLLRSHRKISDEQKADIIEMEIAGARKHQIMNILEMQHGGYDKVGFVSRDIYNFCYQYKLKAIAGLDANTVICHMKERQERDPDFFFKYVVDEEGHLKHLFWSDTQSRLDYAAFGDVVVFDSTYRTNRYNLPFVPFVGLNHHRSTVVFGCGIITHETSEAYEWLLQTFLAAMAQKHPISVITDGDLAMQKAIRTILPNCNHRLCIWHIERNIIRNLHNSKIREEFTVFLYDQCSIEEIEKKWGEFMERNNISSRIVKNPLRVVICYFVVLALLQSYIANFSDLTVKLMFDEAVRDDGARLAGDPVYKSYQFESYKPPIRWIFLKLLTKEFWLTTVGFFFTGFVVWMIERSINPEFQGSDLEQFSTASYFALSTLTFSHGQILRSPLSKIVVVVWCFAVLVLVSSYTAQLSSMIAAEASTSNDSSTSAPVPAETLTSNGGSASGPVPLTLQSFSGLFVLTGGISALMLLISLTKSVYTRYTRVRGSDSESQGANGDGRSVGPPGEFSAAPAQDDTVNGSVPDQDQRPQALMDNDPQDAVEDADVEAGPMQDYNMDNGSLPEVSVRIEMTGATDHGAGWALKMAIPNCGQIPCSFFWFEIITSML
ncbi:hypothetical protein U9M48_029499 [Paspalum notatum var. saurae]|uniref:Protein FAR1-RELATED SEQUENCE n=1 Tax=Paspalum notatum var. saurae TaxID=547442 RepID=A0AAQ3X1M6_PASNO